jgi:hypothetical protein
MMTSRELRTGALTGIAAMLAMDISLAMEFQIAQIPSDAYLSLIGSVFGGKATLGLLLQYVAGAVSGIVFALLATHTILRNIRTIRGWVVLGVLMGAATTLVDCVPLALLAGQPVTRILRFMIVPHIAWGLVMSLIAGYGLNLQRERSRA